ncbi:MAG: site-2 protease family protein [Candidatus Omnitrophica bacterium]|nr:site-2 protease family protein [Candidatus Omnitrophota bacterium]
MRGSIKLFKAFGIAVRIHFSFLLLPLLFGYFYGLKGVVLVFFVFCCVTLHELCHSLQAKRFGVRVDQIILLPIGGIASMGSIPEKPSQEFKISIAGPLFNIVFAIILFFPFYFILGPENLFNPDIETWPQTFAYAFWINPILAIFNLLPAFPMDGGRILRSFLASKMEYVKATRIAVGFGHTFAILFGFLGIFSTPPNLILIVIAFFIYMAATQEGMQVDIRSTLKKFYVKDVLPEQFLHVSPGSLLSEVLAISLHSHQEDFPVVEQGKLVGLLTRSNIMYAIHQFGMQKQVKDIMTRDFPKLHVDDPLTKAHKMMEEWRIKAIPVVYKDQIVGVVSLEDISRVYLLMSGKR